MTTLMNTKTLFAAQNQIRLLQSPASAPIAAWPQLGVAGCDQMQPQLERLLSALAPISLNEMDGVALQDRIDTKYVFHSDHLLGVLGGLAERYRILEIDGVRLHRYQTLYFDTADFALYRQHHDGRRNRYKVRSRKYLDTDLSCLEVKFKATSDRTIKSRTRTPQFVDSLGPQDGDFLRRILPVAAADLAPQLWNSFSRITMVSKTAQERLTLDVAVQFSAGDTDVELARIVVAEVKQGRHSQTSDFIRLMREHHIRSTSFSKYCIGVSLLYPTLKHNNFITQQRLLRKLLQGAQSVND